MSKGKTILRMCMSAGKITHETVCTPEDILTGDDAETIITCEEGQFGSTEFLELEDGFALKFRGTFEAGEFMSAMARFAYNHGYWPFEQEQDDGDQK